MELRRVKDCTAEQPRNPKLKFEFRIFEQKMAGRGRSYFNIEALMSNHGPAGKSIAKNIMSYLPIQTLTRGLRVSKVSFFKSFIVKN